MSRKSRNKKKFEPYLIEDLKLEKFVNGGQALGYTVEGKPIFVWGGIAGEIVDVQVMKSKRGVLEALVEKVNLKSKNRVEPKEPEEYLSTSPWQILSLGYENQVKAELLEQTFKHELGLELKDLELISSDKNTGYGYRNKMEYAFWGDEDGLSLALHKRGSGQKIKLKGSALASDAINKAGKSLVGLLNEKQIFAGKLKSLVLRSDGFGGCAGALFVKAEDFLELELPEALEGLVCYYSNPKSPASVITSELWRKGELKLKDQVCGTDIGYDVNSFFQVNIDLFEKVIEDIKLNLDSEDSKIIDFYGGVGSIGILLAGNDNQLKIVEISKESAEKAQQNLARLGLNKASVFCGAAEDLLEEIEQNSVLVVDPPRAGLHKKVTQKIIEVKPKKLIYLSCNPVTQARDVGLLLEAGYKIKFNRGYNFFPRTPHIESLMILEIK
jgi:23S rRNA (uracil1939-C5)-methyltransferase